MTEDEDMEKLKESMENENIQAIKYKQQQMLQQNETAQDKNNGERSEKKRYRLLPFHFIKRLLYFFHIDLRIILQPDTVFVGGMYHGNAIFAKNLQFTD